MFLTKTKTGNWILQEILHYETFSDFSTCVAVLSMDCFRITMFTCNIENTKLLKLVIYMYFKRQLKFACISHLLDNVIGHGGQNEIIVDYKFSSEERILKTWC